MVTSEGPMNRREVREMIREELDNYGEWVALRIVLAIVDPIARALSRNESEQFISAALDKMKVEHRKQAAQYDAEVAKELREAEDE